MLSSDVGRREERQLLLLRGVKCILLRPVASRFRERCFRRTTEYRGLTFGPCDRASYCYKNILCTSDRNA